jgi:hypothetical protein
MSSTIRYKKGDTAALQYQITTFDGIGSQRNVPVDLTGKTVKFHMVHDEYPTIGLINKSCEIVDPNVGIVLYQFATYDLVIPGMYRTCFKVYDDITNEITTFPEYEQQWIYIMEE